MLCKNPVFVYYLCIPTFGQTIFCSIDCIELIILLFRFALTKSCVIVREDLILKTVAHRVRDNKRIQESKGGTSRQFILS